MKRVQTAMAWSWVRWESWDFWASWAAGAATGGGHSRVASLPAVVVELGERLAVQDMPDGLLSGKIGGTASSELARIVRAMSLRLTLQRGP